MSFPTFKKNVQNQPDPVKTVMEAAAFLLESNEIDKKQWRKFSKRFFEEYRETIINYYGYDKEMFFLPPMEVKYPRFFIAVMSILLEMKIIEGKTKYFADTLHKIFRFDEKNSTIRQWFYDIPTEYEELLINFKRAFNTLKNRK